MHVGTLWLNRTRERNHMTPELLADFSRAVGQARRDAGARAVLVAASEPGGAAGGTASFCAGADLRGGLQAGAALPGASDAERSFAMYEPFLGLLDLQVPVVAAVNGHAVGGGFGMAMLADVRIVSKEARVGANFCRLGLAPGMAIRYVCVLCVRGVPYSQRESQEAAKPKPILRLGPITGVRLANHVSYRRITSAATRPEVSCGVDIVLTLCCPSIVVATRCRGWWASSGRWR